MKADRASDQRPAPSHTARQARVVNDKVALSAFVDVNFLLRTSKMSAVTLIRVLKWLVLAIDALVDQGCREQSASTGWEVQ
jgi:hypothetical protein